MMALGRQGGRIKQTKYCTAGSKEELNFAHLVVNYSLADLSSQLVAVTSILSPHPCLSLQAFVKYLLAPPKARHRRFCP